MDAISERRKKTLPLIQTVSVILLTGCFAFKKIWHWSFSMAFERSQMHNSLSLCALLFEFCCYSICKRIEGRMYSAHFLLFVTQKEGVLAWLTVGLWQDRWEVAKCKWTVSASLIVCHPLYLMARDAKNCLLRARVVWTVISELWGNTYDFGTASSAMQRFPPQVWA